MDGRLGRCAARRCRAVLDAAAGTRGAAELVLGWLLEPAPPRPAAADDDACDLLARAAAWLRSDAASSWPPRRSRRARRRCAARSARRRSRSGSPRRSAGSEAPPHAAHWLAVVHGLAAADGSAADARAELRAAAKAVVEGGEERPTAAGSALARLLLLARAVCDAPGGGSAGYRAFVVDVYDEVAAPLDARGGGEAARERVLRAMAALVPAMDDEAVETHLQLGKPWQKLDAGADLIALLRSRQGEGPKSDRDAPAILGEVMAAFAADPHHRCRSSSQSGT